MHGDTREPLPLDDTKARVQDYVAEVNDLLARGADAPVAAVEDAIARGRELQATKTALTGTLYLEEAIRRLKRERLARVPVEDTNVYADYAEQYAERFAKPVVLRRGADDLGITYATLAACLERAEVPDAKPPHKVRVEPDGTLWTRLNGTPSPSTWSRSRTTKCSCARSCWAPAAHLASRTRPRWRGCCWIRVFDLLFSIQRTPQHRVPGLFPQI
ncbi:MAG: hypothetical protein U5L06_09005 [Rhodovibrio sp.]|nr:hypothetical protein [Rhodovibrio sp.]